MAFPGSVHWTPALACLRDLANCHKCLPSDVREPFPQPSVIADHRS
jgi:hypothetical protein